MSDSIVKQVLENGNRNYRAVFNVVVAAGVGPSVILDPTSSGDMGVTIAGNTLYPGKSLKIWEMRYDISAGIGATLAWDATSAQVFWQPYGFDKKSFMREGGLSTIGIAGATGKVLLTLPATAGSFTLEIWAKKDFSQ